MRRAEWQQADGWHRLLRAHLVAPERFGRLNKEPIATAALKRRRITAAQLGVVMDQFTSDLTKLDVVKAVASNVVNPEHAIGHSTKFSSPLSSGEYVELMNQ